MPVIDTTPNNYYLPWAIDAKRTAYPQDLFDDTKTCEMDYKVQEASTVLTGEYGVDAHCVTYVVYRDGKPLQTQPRLVKGCLHDLRERGFEVRHGFLISDVDRPDHAPMDPQSTLDATALLAKIPDIGWYTTRAGFRVIRQLSNQLTPEQWEAAIVPFQQELQTALGDQWVVDTACKEWNRHFRLPYVIRGKERLDTKLSCEMDLSRLRPVDNTVPDCALEKKREPRKIDPQLAKQLHDTGDHPASLALLKRACEELASARPGTRHRNLIKWAFTVGGHVAAGGISYDDAYAQLWDAIRHYDGANDDKKLADSLENGMADPVRLDPKYERYQPNQQAAQELEDNLNFDADYEAADLEDKPEVKPNWSQILTRKSRSQDYKATPLNIRRWLENQPGWKTLLAFDDFSEEIIFTAKPKWGAIFPEAANAKAGDHWTDGDTTRLQMALNSIGLDAGRETIDAVILEHAKANRVHVVQQYFASLKHDGSKRLDSWLTRYCGVESTDYSRKAGRWWLIQVVRRAMIPGSLGKYVLSLEGPQNIGKSTGLKKLAGETWFHESKIDVGSKEAPMSMIGKLILELAEGEILTRASNEAMKQFIGQTHDTIVPKYSNRAVSRARHTCFVMTVNPGSSGTYLSDKTGNCRYWPVVCTAVDIDAIERDRDQLWAEAYAAYMAGEIPEPRSDADKVLFAEVVEERVHTDSWDVALIKAIPSDCTEITVCEALELIDIKPKDQKRVDQTRAGNALKSAGWQHGGRKLIEGVKVTVYVRDKSEIPLKPVDMPSTTEIFQAAGVEI